MKEQDYIVKDDMICPVTKAHCDDECCPVGSTCNVWWLCVCYFGLQTLAFKDKFYSQNNSTKPLLAAGAVN